MEYTSWRKSTRSSNTANSDCVECRQTWRKSSRSNNTSNADCVEARSTTTGFQVRDSKLQHESPVFELSAEDFTSFLSATLPKARR
ncbi:protein of unknown function [Glycomyces sambucus]|uniref:DUF397 domain-containing protein n=1 Tax=Glycomyces sambucus TaxID=380244 RepID=A0A1G9MEH7_9ACTN|nr:DUF397 domain-containing protein [Glycomyces sambucus]SDL72670.1 protein of unknown function [Glycomyces sambucus]